MQTSPDVYTALGYKAKKTTIVEAYVHDDTVCVVSLNNGKRQRRMINIWSVSNKVLLQLSPEIRDEIISYRRIHPHPKKEDKNLKITTQETNDCETDTTTSTTDINNPALGYKAKKTTIVEAYIHDDTVCVVSLNNGKRSRRTTSIWSVSNKVLLQLPSNIQDTILSYRATHFK